MDEKARLDEEIRLVALWKDAPPDAPGKRVTLSEPEAPTAPSSLACALLAIVWHLASANAYRVAEEVKRNGGALGAATSTVHRTLKDLAAGGYLDRREEGSAGKPVVVYLVSEKGRLAVENWLAAEIGDRVDLSSAEVIGRVRGGRAARTNRLPLISLRAYKDALADELEELGSEQRRARRGTNWDELVGVEYELRRDLLKAHLAYVEQAVGYYAKQLVEEEEKELRSGRG